MKKGLMAILAIIMFIMPLSANSFSEDYSIMVLIQEQLDEVSICTGQLKNVLIVPDTLFEMNGITLELSTEQKKELFDRAVVRWNKLKDSYDSLRTLIQAFEKDSIL